MFSLFQVQRLLQGSDLLALLSVSKSLLVQLGLEARRDGLWGHGLHALYVRWLLCLQILELLKFYGLGSLLGPV